ncbi:molybdopterin-dependent oxidoreductase [Humibacter ginsenosidimutans]|uniref:Molybdopterin-dependent oxidoreductase n=1 Tax=Humibacter ginsenosidimutans TaxID=2599293 RepID=A0A5B8M9I1_9MICO|nr:molybdopterin-dependent oxidoreductase [Humibacter ginsenosidimutans]QDZ16262.1 molybdopterin-dependent oxidoreductase [Humibacter ginsenosidimutans]
MPSTAVAPRGRALSATAAVCGVVAAVAGWAVAEVLAVFVGAASGPLFAVGSWVIDLTPGWLKDAVVGLFGTGDKIFLLVVLGVVVIALTCVAGILELVRRPFGMLLLGVIGVIALIAVMTRADATYWWLLPTVAGTLVGVYVLARLIDRLREWVDASAPSRVPVDRSAPARRSFLALGIGVGAVAIVAGVVARSINAGSVAVASARAMVRLPAPVKPAPAIPEGADLRLSGLTPYVTPNGDFYRIDTALQIPSIDPDTWKLTIGGMVDTPVTVTWAQLLSLPLEEHTITLACVSNDVGGDLVGNATWLGYPVRKLLARAKPHATADMVLSRSVDGFTAGTPLGVLTDLNTDALIAVGMNGSPLPLEHGFPVRMVVPGLYGYVSATKWLTELTVTRFDRAQGYWTDKGWSEKGPIKTASRIDRPREAASIRAGRYAVAGVAWDQHTGIRSVEVRVDNGGWQQARLAETVSVDTWRQWVWEWDAPAGHHTLQVRATNDDGYTQTSAVAPPAPNGATGWHTVSVDVR